MLKAIVIDDEPFAAEVIKGFSEKVTFIELTGSFTSTSEAVHFLHNHPTNLVFLDIRMPDVSGIDLARSLPGAPMIIFTTAYSEHAVTGFELNAIDYLLKPFSLTRFLQACNKAYELHKWQSSKTPDSYSLHIFIKSGHEQIKVALDSIQYVESNGNYVSFVLEDQKILSRLTMNEAEALLPAGNFLRVHRSYIVSKKHIKKIDKKSVWVAHIPIPLGALYLPEIEKLIT